MLSKRLLFDKASSVIIIVDTREYRINQSWMFFTVHTVHLFTDTKFAAWCLFRVDIEFPFVLNSTWICSSQCSIINIFTRTAWVLSLTSCGWGAVIVCRAFQRELHSGTGQILCPTLTTTCMSGTGSREKGAADKSRPHCASSTRCHKAHAVP